MNRAFVMIWDNGTLSTNAKFVGLRLASVTGVDFTGLIWERDLLQWAGLTQNQLAAALLELGINGIIDTKLIKGGNARGYSVTISAEEMANTYGWEIEDDLPDEGATADSNVQPIRSRRERILNKTNGRCFYCGEVGAEMHLDHMKPKSRGGSNEDENLVAACAACNIQKRDKTVEEYRLYLSYKRKAEITVVFAGERPLGPVFTRPEWQSMIEAWLIDNVWAPQFGPRPDSPEYAGPPVSDFQRTA